MKKHFNVALYAVFAIVVFSSCRGKVAHIEENKGSPDTVFMPKKIEKSVSITAVGDIMIGSAFPSAANLPKDDALNSFEAVKDYLTGDIVFGNLEGCFLDDGNSTKCKGYNSKTCYAFRMPTRYGGIIKGAGFNVLSIANNHIGDFGRLGRKTTAKVLDSLQIRYAGQPKKLFDVFTINGVKYGFLAFAANEWMVDIRDHSAAQELVRKVKEQADIVIVSFHGGGEGARFEHVTKAVEVFYREDRGNVYAFSHAVIDAGADLVLGHGPHVTRAVEVYKGKFIAYSLGNFCTYGKFSLSGPSGIAPLLQINLALNGDFLSGKVVSVKQDKQRGLTLDSTNAAFYKIKSLTDADFSDHRLNFDDRTISLKDNEK